MQGQADLGFAGLTADLPRGLGHPEPSHIQNCGRSDTGHRSGTHACYGPANHAEANVGQDETETVLALPNYSRAEGGGNSRELKKKKKWPVVP